MRLIAVEPTPNPNKMKLSVDETLPRGVTRTCTSSEDSGSPQLLRALVRVDGVASAVHAINFITIEREAKADWEPIIERITGLFEEVEEDATAESRTDIRVFVQMFRAIPAQVKLQWGVEERRVGLPQRFRDAVMAAAAHDQGNLITERRWESYGVLAGDPEEIGARVARELSERYDEEALQKLVDRAAASCESEDPSTAAPADLRSANWKERYAALDGMEASEAQLPNIVQLAKDPNGAVRRLATAYLGAIGGDEAVRVLVDQLKDPSITVRRTAGDALSDLGDPRGIPAMRQRLKDPSRLVRWRAARYLYEVGDRSALEDLRDRMHDPEYEVALQVRMAIAAIEEREANADDSVGED